MKNELELMALGPLTLAYMGDALMSLQVREYVIRKGFHKPLDLQLQSVKFVSAKAQARIVTWFLEENFLTENEIAIYKRGRNAQSATVPKNTDVITYRMATGLETLWGYLYFAKCDERIEELWLLVKTFVENDMPKKTEEAK